MNDDIVLKEVVFSPPSDLYLNNSYSFSCWPKKFRCLDHRCVKMSHRCDGIWDCGRGEDEVSCDNVCKGGQFTCRDHKSCIPLNR